MDLKFILQMLGKKHLLPLVYRLIIDFCEQKLRELNENQKPQNFNSNNQNHF